MTFLNHYQCQQLWLGYSGGLDSTVLLHILANSQYRDKLTALHINHQLQKKADKWATHCQTICQQLHIPYHSIILTERPQKGQSVEAWAREQRYQAFAHYLEDKNNLLLTGQHADDQAETVLLQLMRAAGPKGLSAMPTERILGKGKLLRPLRAFSRQQLLDYAKQHQLHWIEDDSNQDLRYDRNYLRQKIMPLLKRRWPQALKMIDKSAQRCAEQQMLCEQLAASDLSSAGHSVKQLAINHLQTLNQPRFNNLIRYWLQQIHFPKIRHMQLNELWQQLGAANDKNPLIALANGYSLRRYQGQLYAVLPPWQQAQNTRITWTGTTDLEINGFVIQPKHIPLATTCFDWQQVYIDFRDNLTTLQWKGQTRPIKKILQQEGIPPWIRSTIPFVCYQQQLLFIPRIDSST